MSEQVARAIRAAIADHGPITFAEFMELALYGAGGYYERTPVGREGDFVTSPHVHPIFAELLLLGIRDLWERLGHPEPLEVVEIGAGDGTLADGLLRLAEEQGPPIAYTAVERSAGARERLASLPIRVVEEVGRLRPLDPGVILANELLDNLPFRRVRGGRGGPVEILVGTGGDRLVEVPAPCPAWLAARTPTLSPGQDAAVPEAALDMIDDLAATLRSGYALLIDYGSSIGPAGQVHGYRRHAVVEDVLAVPGDADVTAGVDLRLVRRRAADRGLSILGEVAQGRVLRSMGFDAWDRLQRERQTSTREPPTGSRAVAIWQGRSRASLLVDPAALGRLRWLLLSTQGLEGPAWAGDDPAPLRRSAD